MASLFITPSSVIKRIREIREYFQLLPTAFPEFEVYGGAELDLIKKAGNKTMPISLYVTNSNGSGSVITAGGGYPTEIVTNIEIILIVRTEDIRGEQADEIGIGFKNFLVRALHTWTQSDIPGSQPIRLTADSSFGVDGQAVYIHTYTFTQIKDVTPSCLEDVTGTWEDLDWYNTTAVSAVYSISDEDSQTDIMMIYPNVPPLSG